MTMNEIDKLLNSLSDLNEPQKRDLKKFLYEINQRIDASRVWRDLTIFIDNTSDNFNYKKREEILKEIKATRSKALAKCAVTYENFLDSQTQNQAKKQTAAVISSIIKNSISRLIEIKASIDDPNVELITEDSKQNHQQNSFDIEGLEADWNDFLKNSTAESEEKEITSDDSKDLTQLSPKEILNTTELEEPEIIHPIGDIKSLDLDELITRFNSIGKQAQLFQGLILFEVRNRFSSDKEFGKWISTRTLCSGSSPQQRTRLINLGKFFRGRDMTGIAITAAYEISAPKNADVADAIYKHAHGKDLSVEEIKAKIQEYKELKNTLKVEEISTPEIHDSEVELMPEIDKDDLKSQLHLIMDSIPADVVKKIFKEYLSEFKKSK